MSDHIRSIEVERDLAMSQKRALVDAVERAALAGETSAGIEAAALPFFSRDQVRQYVAALRLRETARALLRDAGLSGAVDARVTGIDAPREVRLGLAADPSEPGYQALPGRIREVFRNFAVLELPAGHPDDSDQVDDLLRDGEAVRLTRRAPEARSARREADPHD